MVHRKMLMVAAGTALALLAGCSGGGGDSSPPLVQVGPPTGTPSPSPSPGTPPTIVYPPAPTVVTSAREFTLYGLFSSSQPPLQQSDVALRWLGSPATYQLRIAGVGEGELRQRTANDTSLFLVDRNGQTLLEGLDIPRPLARYSGLLQSFNAPAFRVLFGIPTPASSLPTTGRRNYANVGADGGAPISIEVDFAARRVTGTIGIAWEDDWGPYAPTTYALTAATFPVGAVEFSVPIDVPGAPAPGTLSGRFSGPNGEELMISWSAQIRNPYEAGSWVTRRGLQVTG